MLQEVSHKTTLVHMLHVSRPSVWVSSEAGQLVSWSTGQLVNYHS